jgi:magnesium transporter
MELNNRFIKNLQPDIHSRKTHRKKKTGAAPGTVVHTGEQHLEEIAITVYDYDQSHFKKIQVDTIQQVKTYLEKPTKTWINIYGLHDIEQLKSIWNFFNLHPLIQEDIVSTTQRPKVESYSNCIFFVLQIFSYDKNRHRLHAEQMSIVLGHDYVLSFQETDRDYFKPIVKRLSIEESRIRQAGTDYLCYALVDTAVDYYFAILEYIADEIEQLEDDFLEEPDSHLLEQIHKIRREIIYFRKAVWPLRDAINSTIRDESKFITSDTKIYLRDVYDHIVQVIDNVENYRDMILGLHDMYMSYVSNRMNEVMKVLTIIATIFIPLTFIAGIYGMNFNTESSPLNMPELNWYWGYPFSLALMAGIAMIMIIYFKRKGWF